MHYFFGFWTGVCGVFWITFQWSFAASGLQWKLITVTHCLRLFYSQLKLQQSSWDTTLHLEQLRFDGFVHFFSASFLSCLVLHWDNGWEDQANVCLAVFSFGHGDYCINAWVFCALSFADCRKHVYGSQSKLPRSKSFSLCVEAYFDVC